MQDHYNFPSTHLKPIMFTNLTLGDKSSPWMNARGSQWARLKQEADPDPSVGYLSLGSEEVGDSRCCATISLFFRASRWGVVRMVGNGRNLTVWNYWHLLQIKGIWKLLPLLEWGERKWGIVSQKSVSKAQYFLELESNPKVASHAHTSEGAVHVECKDCNASAHKPANIDPSS